jgi:class 3 adenylate cyclase
MAPRTRYARNGGMNIAYQVLGEGPVDLVLSPGWVTHLDLQWNVRPLAAFLERLASFSRLILFDKRGTGLSDGIDPSRLPTHEERMDDIRAVMDATKSERAVLLGTLGGGAMCGLFAATYPERARGLILYGTYATWGRDVGLVRRLADTWEAGLERIEREWGSEGTGVAIWAPTVLDDEDATEAFLRLTRSALSPGAARSYVELGYRIDWTDMLPRVEVPTLVIHRSGDLIVPVTCGRELAEAIPGARYAELDGLDHLMWAGDAGQVLQEIEDFLARVAPTGPDLGSAHTRALATVLFTDIVGSTDRATALGDRAWKELLERHHAIVRALLSRYRGREVDTAGDGFFATFDGPARAVRCALEILEGVRPLGLRLRAGVHTGEVETIDGKVGGIGVVVGARIGAMAGADDVLVSSTVKELVMGSDLRFDDAGTHELKGITGTWQLYRAG